MLKLQELNPSTSTSQTPTKIEKKTMVQVLKIKLRTQKNQKNNIHQPQNLSPPPYTDNLWKENNW